MKFFKAIWSVLCDIGKAKYAAELARNHKYREAQALFK